MTYQEYDEFDLEVRKDLLRYSKKWRQLKKLQQQLSQKRLEMERQFDEDTEKERAEIASLEEEIISAKTAAQSKLQIKALTSERRSFLGGMVTIQVRKEPGEYDEERLVKWASRFPYMWKIPEKKKVSMDAFSKARDYLYQHSPELLVLDDAVALRHAIETTKAGHRRYPDAPVEIVDKPTNISDEKFGKVMDTILLEEGLDVEEQTGSTGGRAG